MRVAILPLHLALFAAFVSLPTLVTLVSSTPIPETPRRTVLVNDIPTFLANITALTQWDTIDVSQMPLQTMEEKVQAVQLLETLSKSSQTLIGMQELFNRAAFSEAVDVIQQVLQINLQLNNTLIDPSVNDNYAVRWASKNGQTEVVRLLLQHPRVDPSSENNYAIRWASQNGHTEMVRMLLNDSRVDPSVTINEAIRLASRYGRTEVVRWLLQHPRVDPSTDKNYGIRWASNNGHTEVVRMLLQHPRVDPSAYDNFAIRWASEKGHTEVVKLLSEFAHNRAPTLSVQKVFRDDNDTACIICSETESSKVFAPCGHMCSCDTCAEQIVSYGKLCPLCRASIRGILTLEQATASSSAAQN